MSSYMVAQGIIGHTCCEGLAAPQGRQDLEMTGRNTCISSSCMQPWTQSRISSGRVQT